MFHFQQLFSFYLKLHFKVGWSLLGLCWGYTYNYCLLFCLQLLIRKRTGNVTLPVLNLQNLFALVVRFDKANECFPCFLVVEEFFGCTDFEIVISHNTL